MNRQLVVAKYKEDMAWLRDVPCDTIVYDKCPQTGRHDFPHVTYLDVAQNPRNGREAHTYVGHILHRYHDLADVTFFVQGDPFAHYDHLWSAFHKKVDETLPLSYLNEPAFWASDPPRPFPSIIHRTFPIPHSLFAVETSPFWREVRWRQLFGMAKPPSTCVYGYGAQFAVPRHRIVQRPLSFYVPLFDVLSKGTQPDLADAWSMETLWLYVFGDTHRGGFPDGLLGHPARCMA